MTTSGGRSSGGPTKSRVRGRVVERVGRVTVGRRKLDLFGLGQVCLIDGELELRAQHGARAGGQVVQHDRARFAPRATDVQQHAVTGLQRFDALVGQLEPARRRADRDRPNATGTVLATGRGIDRAIRRDVVPAHAEDPLRTGELGLHRRERCCVARLRTSGTGSTSPTCRTRRRASHPAPTLAGRWKRHRRPRPGVRWPGIRQRRSRRPTARLSSQGMFGWRHASHATRMPSGLRTGLE